MADRRFLGGLMYSGFACLFVVSSAVALAQDVADRGVSGTSVTESSRTASTAVRPDTPSPGSLVVDLRPCEDSTSPPGGASGAAGKEVTRGIARSRSGTVKPNVEVRITPIPPKTVKDAFGRRISNSFIGFQLTVVNHSKDFEFLVQHASIVFPVSPEPLPGRSSTPPPASGQSDHGKSCIELSSLDLAILRGVSERGRTSHPRNLILTALKSIGLVATGVITVDNGIPQGYQRAITWFNGPLTSGYEGLFPDFTINRANRLSDLAYGANTLVPRRQGKVIAAFIPKPFVLNKSEVKLFNADPSWYLRNKAPTIAHVIGDFVVEQDDLSPAVRGVESAPLNAQTLQLLSTDVTSTVTGEFLQGATPVVEIEGLEISEVDIKGSSINDTGTEMKFSWRAKRPVPPGTEIRIGVKKGSDTALIRESATYSIAHPVDLKTGSSCVEAGKKLGISAQGLLPGQVRARLEGPPAVPIPVEMDRAGGNVNLTIPSGTAVGKVTVRLSSGPSDDGPTVDVDVKTSCP